MQITLGDLITKIRTAQSVMSVQNAHRVLLGQCEAVILSLVDELQATQSRGAVIQPDPAISITELDAAATDQPLIVLS